MKKKLTFIFLILFTSCTNKVSLSRIKQTSGDLFKTVVFDGCEYVEVEYGPRDFRVYNLIHKESCQNHKPNE